MDADLITESLERVGERCADPTPLVYERLFAQNPDMRALFVRDTDDSVKGQMLYQVIEVFLDFIDKYLGTDQDPRLRGTKAKECFTSPELPVLSGSFEK